MLYKTECGLTVQQSEVWSSELPHEEHLTVNKTKIKQIQHIIRNVNFLSHLYASSAFNR